MMDMFSGMQLGDIKQVHKRWQGCKKCDGYKKHWDSKERKQRYRQIMGRGGSRPEVLLVAASPGVGEGREGIAFQGKSGEALIDSLMQVGFSYDQIYATNTIKCYAAESEGKVPDWQQIACAGILEQEIDAIQPKLILGTGKLARIRLFRPKHMNDQRSKGRSLGAARFTVWDYRGFPMVISLSAAVLHRMKGLELKEMADDIRSDHKFIRKVCADLGIGLKGKKNV